MTSDFTKFLLLLFYCNVWGCAARILAVSYIGCCLQRYGDSKVRRQCPVCKKKYGRWWRWALVSPDGVAPSRMVSVSAPVNLPLHHKVEVLFWHRLTRVVLEKGP